MRNWVKKFWGMTCMLSLAVGMVGCGSSTVATNEGPENAADTTVVSDEMTLKTIEKLSIYFVPSREPEEIIATTEKEGSHFSTSSPAFGFC